MFTTPRKAAQQTAQHLISGHVTLIAWWTLRHAGVFDAMLKLEARGEPTSTGARAPSGLNPLVFATRTNMSHEVLAALVEYLVGAGLLSMKNDEARLTSEGRALLECEDGVLELLRAYQPVLSMSEHLLAKLKSYGPAGSTGPSNGKDGSPGGGGGASGGGGVTIASRRNEYHLESQSRRFAPEVFPAVEHLVARHKCTHLLDIACGTGELLIHLAQKLKKIVGVGMGADPMMIRRANTAITAADLEARLIAVAAAPLEVCTDTPRAFERVGLSRQLWNELDLVILSGVLSDLASAGAEPVAMMTRALAGLRKSFPKASLLVIEPVDSPRFHRNYYAPEMALLLRLTRAVPWPVEKWRELFGAGGYRSAEETPLTTDGVTLFMLSPISSAVPAAPGAKESALKKMRA